MSYKENLELRQLMNKIILKKEKSLYTDYTMTEIQKIAETAIVAIKEGSNDQEALNALNKAIERSDHHHKNGDYNKEDSIKEVLDLTHYGLETCLDKGF